MRRLLLAFIPARGGSKSIPGKNLALLAGQPLIKYTLNICKQLDEIRSTLVSTDDEEIALLSAGEGFDTSYRRPSNLSSDKAGMLETVLHGIDWFENSHNCRVDDVLLLQPTSPLRTLDDVKNAISYYYSNNISSLMSVSPMREHPYECIEIKYDGNPWEYLKKPDLQMKRRQDYKGEFGFIDGSIYIFSTDFIRKDSANIVIEGETDIFFCGQRYNIDIDEPEDLAIAESILKSMK